jgi:hypothetical protein
VTLINELTYRTYAYNRATFPTTEPERWALLFGEDETRIMEARFQREHAEVGDLTWVPYEDLDQLCATVELTTAKSDPALYLADVLTHLANHKPMTSGDEAAYNHVKWAQNRCWPQTLPDVNAQRAYYAGCE